MPIYPFIRLTVAFGREPRAQVRRDVGHPVIDADGHMLEVLDATHPFLRESLGATRF